MKRRTFLKGLTLALAGLVVGGVVSEEEDEQGADEPPSTL
jgi:hypothetical protein